MISIYQRSHIGQSRDQDLGHLADQVNRHCEQHTQSHAPSPSGANALKFTNLLSRLLDQPVISKKHSAVLFLHTLASSSRHLPDTRPFLPSLPPPPVSRPPPSAAQPQNPKGKSKADILRQYRSKARK